MSRRRGLVVFAVVLLLVGYVAAQIHLRDRHRRSSVTVYNEGAAGLSLFLRWRNRVEEASFRPKGSAFLTEKDLAEDEALLLFSPNAPLSVREAKLIAAHVKKGGILWLGAHNRLAWFHLQPLLSLLDLRRELADHDGFANGYARPVSARAPVAWFPPDREYLVYSPVVFEAGCESYLDCYVRESPVGDGKVVISLGLPPVANALLGGEGNRAAALATLGEMPRMVVDEYHHHFSDKTVKDLARKLTFSLPLLGMILLTVLYFLFARTSFHVRSAQPDPPRRVPSFHEWNENLTGTLAESTAVLPTLLSQQVRFLVRRFPEREAEIAAAYGATDGRPVIVSRKECLKRAARLAALHRKWLQEKGRIPK